MISRAWVKRKEELIEGTDCTQTVRIGSILEQTGCGYESGTVVLTGGISSIKHETHV